MSLLITRMAKCPFCRARVNMYVKQCPSCEVDLSLMADLNLLPYALFNQGLERFHDGDLYAALVKLSAAAELGKDFREAHLMLAKVADAIGLEEMAVRHRETANGTKT